MGVGVQPGNNAEGLEEEEESCKIVIYTLKHALQVAH